MLKLICPKDRLPLENLRCANGHEYLSYEGIPILLRDDVPETIWTYKLSLQQARLEAPLYDGDYVSELVASAAGSLYTPLVGRISEYPIPELPIKGTGL